MKRIEFYFVNNNQGSMMMVVLLMLAALTLTVFMGMDSSLMNSSMMQRNRDYRDNLYRSESGISLAEEVHRTNWLQPTSVLFDLTDGNAEVSDQAANVNDENGNSVNVAEYDIARIEDYDDPSVDAILDDDALSREFYSLPHICPPAIGSGFSAINFEIRRYGIASRAVDIQNILTTLTLEAGFSKVFSKM